MFQTTNQYARIADFKDKAAELTEARRHLHAHPELPFVEHDKNAFVTDRLER